MSGDKPITDRNYETYVQPLRLRTEMIFPSFRGKISDFSLVHHQQTTPDSPIWTETYHAYAPGTGAFAPSDLAPIVDGKPREDLRNCGPHAHNDFDEIYFSTEQTLPTTPVWAARLKCGWGMERMLKSSS
jgi:hypothetical protein